MILYSGMEVIASVDQLHTKLLCVCVCTCTHVGRRDTWLDPDVMAVMEAKGLHTRNEC